MHQRCKSCRMPLPTGTYCPRCTDAHGLLIPFDALHAELTHEVMVHNEGMCRADAQDVARRLMARAPAWAEHPEVTAHRDPRSA